MKELTSVNNPVVKAAADLKQKKHRLAQQSFLVEGLRSVEEALRMGKVRQLFVLEEAKTAEPERQNAVIAQAAASGVEVYAVTPQVMKKIADTETPQSLTAIAAKPEGNLAKLTSVGGILLVLDRISDPGNLGTMIRAADAAGVNGVVLLTGCADAFAPKTVRATMGSLLHLPVIEGICETDFINWASENDYKLLVTCLTDAESLYQTNLTGALAVVIGSEAFGVSSGLLASATKKVYIPMEGLAESLNAGIAAGVVLFECLRQRLAGKSKL